MKERPILFSGHMVRAILVGQKTQTRRVWELPKWAEWDCIQGGEASGSLIPKDPALRGWYSVDEVACPYGQIGNRLWVRESFAMHTKGADALQGTKYDSPWYRADSDSYGLLGHDGLGPVYAEDLEWKPSIHMPRTACRIILEITDLRVERLHGITEADAQAEGVERVVIGAGWRRYCDPDSEEVGIPPCGDARRSFRSLWKHINGAESWNANPWVWIVEFKRVLL